MMKFLDDMVPDKWVAAALPPKTRCRAVAGFSGERLVEFRELTYRNGKKAGYIFTINVSGLLTHP
jgi:hypothetical protein